MYRVNEWVKVKPRVTRAGRRRAEGDHAGEEAQSVTTGRGRAEGDHRDEARRGRPRGGGSADSVGSSRPPGLEQRTQQRTAGAGTRLGFEDVTRDRPLLQPAVEHGFVACTWSQVGALLTVPELRKPVGVFLGGDPRGFLLFFLFL